MAKLKQAVCDIVAHTHLKLILYRRLKVSSMHVLERRIHSGTTHWQRSIHFFPTKTI